MTNKLLMLLVVAIPLLGSFIVLISGKRMREFLALCTGVATAVCASLLIPAAMRGEVTVFRREMIMGLGFYFRADGLSILFAVMSSIVGTLILLYSIGYMKKYEHLGEYYFAVVLFIGSMMGLVFSDNLILLYIFWELAAICSWKLIGFHRRERDTRAANKAFLITFSASSAMLVGFILIYLRTGTLILSELRGVNVGGWILFLIFIGIMGKSCIFPLQTWLPDAGVAPSPVTGLLHAAVLVKIGIYAFARLFCQTFPLPYSMHGQLALWALISALIAGSAALRETDIKRILAQSTISQLGLIMAALAVCSDISITGALLFIIAHAFGKAGLFLCAGVVEQKTEVRDITQLGGMIKNMPVTTTVFAICALSVAGIPPMLGFWGKFLMITAPVKEGYFVLAALFVICSILTLLYLLRLFNAVFLGKPSHPEVREGSAVMLVSIVILAALSILGGLVVQCPGGLVEAVKTQVMAMK